MEITLSIGQVLLGLLIIVGVIALIYLIVLLKKLTGTLTELDSVLEDAKKITTVVADKTEKASVLIDNVGETVGQMSGVVKGNQSTIKAATNFVNATTSLVNLVKGKETK